MPWRKTVRFEHAVLESVWVGDDGLTRTIEVNQYSPIHIYMYIYIYIYESTPLQQINYDSDPFLSERIERVSVICITIYVYMAIWLYGYK